MKESKTNKNSVKKITPKKSCWSCGRECWRDDVHYCWDCYKYQMFESR